MSRSSQQLVHQDGNSSSFGAQDSNFGAGGSPHDSNFGATASPHDSISNVGASSNAALATPDLLLHSNVMPGRSDNHHPPTSYSQTTQPEEVIPFKVKV